MLTGVLEAAVYADDLEEARRFYGQVLGLTEIAARRGRHVFFRCGGSVVLVFCAEATRTPPPPGAALPVPPHGATGAGHLCLAVAEADMAALVTRLQRAGVAIEADFCWPNGVRSVYVRDPAGNSVEFAAPRLWGLDR